MDWPSKNIPYGGILHPAKATYSPETHNFLKVLMEESKLTMMQRKKINYSLRNGEPLPFNSSMKRNNRSNIPRVTIRPGSSKKRSIQTIINSGAYQPEEYRPTGPVMDREKEKEKLANKMAYNKDIQVDKNKMLRKKVKEIITKDEPNRFDQLLEEIKERENWLMEMEQLGCGDKYKALIQQQIRYKLKEMEKLKISSSS